MFCVQSKKQKGGVRSFYMDNAAQQHLQRHPETSPDELIALSRPKLDTPALDFSKPNAAPTKKGTVNIANKSAPLDIPSMDKTE